MMHRTVAQWKEILKDMSAEQAAKRIMVDLTHYHEGRTFGTDDQKQLANALRAYSSLITDGD